MIFVSLFVLNLWKTEISRIYLHIQVSYKIMHFSETVSHIKDIFKPIDVI